MMGESCPGLNMSDNPSDLTNLSGSITEVLQSVFLCYLPAAIYGGNTPAPIAPQAGTLVLLATRWQSIQASWSCAF